MAEWASVPSESRAFIRISWLMGRSSCRESLCRETGSCGTLDMYEDGDGELSGVVVLFG